MTVLSTQVRDEILSKRDLILLQFCLSFSKNYDRIFTMQSPAAEKNLQHQTWTLWMTTSRNYFQSGIQTMYSFKFRARESRRKYYSLQLSLRRSRKTRQNFTSIRWRFLSSSSRLSRVILFNILLFSRSFLPFDDKNDETMKGFPSPESSSVTFFSFI